MRPTSTPVVSDSSLSSHVDDDSSTSSTVLISHQQPKFLIRIHPTNNPVKRVHFQESFNVSHENHHCCVEELMELWYTGDEYKEFKDYYIRSIKEIVRPKKEKKELKSYTMVLKSIYEACCLVEKDFAKQSILHHAHCFRRCVEHSPTKVGLDKQANRCVARDRQVRRMQLLDTIHDLQADGNIDEYTSELIRVSCESISLPSRLFATCLAFGHDLAENC